MFNFRVYTKKDGAYNNKIDGVAVFPLSIGELLDEQLDEAHLTIKLSHTEHFEPLTDVKIELLQDDVVVKNLYMIIASDNSFEFPIGKGTYTHNLYLIERTKLLEGTLCQSITFTNALGNSGYENNNATSYINDTRKRWTINDAGLQVYTETTEGNYFENLKDVYHTPTKANTEILSPFEIAELIGLDTTPSVLGNQIYGDLTINENKYHQNKDTEWEKVFAKTSGTYTIKYEITSYGGNNGTDYIIEFAFNVVENRYPLKPYTITDCINRVLDLAEPLMVGETPKYTLNEAQATEFDRIKAPEFTMTQCTLREQLKIIGNYIHAEVRLGGYDANGVYQPNQIFFDKYGQANKSSLVNAPYVYKGQKQDISQYCTDVQTNASNIVNSLNYAQGVIIEPDISNTKTLRTESINLKLTESTSKVMTQLPIYKITKVECGLYDDGGNLLFDITDITPYIFEAHEYFSTLSSYEGTYPYAKTYAIYYTQGEKGLDGLFFKPESARDPVWKNYAITNILNAVTGQNENNKTFEEHFPTLCFRVSYLPIYEAKFSHNKQLVIPSSKKFSQVYNQSDNLIETSYYGENIKGVAQRLGNVEQTRTYYLHNIADIPKVQDSIDGFVISAVNTELLWGYIKCTVALSKDFNRISQYVGINSNKRIAEVSEKQAYKRDILIKEYVVFGDYDDQKDMKESKIFTNADSIYQTLIPNDEKNINPITACVFAPYSNANKKAIVQPLKLPVVSSAFGNSMVFSFAFKDNYSAGEQIKPMGKEDKISSLQAYWQTDTPYCNYYGRIKCADIKMLNAIESKEFEQANTPTYMGNDTSNIQSEAPILIRKDSREILSFNFEVEFVTTRKDCIIGSALASFNPLVTTTNTKPQVRFYKRKIGAFETSIKDDKFTLGSMAKVGDGISVYFPYQTEFQSWAIVMPNYSEEEKLFEDEDGNVTSVREQKGGEVLFICNKSVYDYGDKTNDYICISLKHKIYNE